MNKYSVLIPVYNAEKYLNQCIDSVINQTYDNWEIVLVNDGSVDNSDTICDQYASQYDNIHVYHRPNLGVLKTRVFAYEKSSGDYCIYLDSDDFWDKDLLQTVNDEIEKSNSELVIFNLKKVDAEGEFLNDRILWDESKSFAKDDIMTALATTGNLNSLCNKAFKRQKKYLDYFKNIPELVTGEDYLMSIYVIEHSHNPVYINKSMYNYRTVDTSITRTYNEKYIDATYICSKRRLALLEKHKLNTSANMNQLYATMIKSALHGFSQVSLSKISFSQKVKLMKDYFAKFNELIHAYYSKEPKLKISVSLSVKYFLYKNRLAAVYIVVQKLMRVVGGVMP